MSKSTTKWGVWVTRHYYRDAIRRQPNGWLMRDGGLMSDDDLGLHYARADAVIYDDYQDATAKAEEYNQGTRYLLHGESATPTAEPKKTNG